MAWENLTLDDETTNGAADTTAAPATDVTGLGTATGGLDDGSLVDNGGADASVDTVDSSGDDETAKQKANALVGAAENLVNSVEEALAKVANERNLRSLWGSVDPHLAAFGYVAYMILQFGIDETAEKLGIPVEVIHKISSWLKYIDELRNLTLDAPAIVPIALISWLTKRMGKGEFTRQVIKQAGESFTKAPASYGHVGAALVGRGAPPWVGQMVASRGGAVVAAITAFLYRHQIYGAGKAFYDANKARKSDVVKDLESDIYDQGDPDNPKRLTIDPKTGVVTVNKNKGGYINPMKKKYMSKMYNRY